VQFKSLQSLCVLCYMHVLECECVIIFLCHSYIYIYIYNNIWGSKNYFYWKKRYVSIVGVFAKKKIVTISLLHELTPWLQTYHVHPTIALSEEKKAFETIVHLRETISRYNQMNKSFGLHKCTKPFHNLFGLKKTNCTKMELLPLFSFSYTPNAFPTNT